MLDYILPIPTSPTHKIIDGSKLSRFMECHRAFFFEYMLGWRRDRPNNHLIFGHAFHEAMEFLLLNGYSKASQEKAYDLFLKEYRKELSENTDALFSPKEPARVPAALAGYCDRWADDLSNYEVLYTEIDGRITIDGNPDDGTDRHIYFRMDSIVREKATGLVGSLEHKTGTSLNRAWREKWDLSVQAGVYSHVLYNTFEDIFGIHFNGVFFKKVKDPTKWFDFGRAYVHRTKTQMLTWWHMTRYWFDKLEQEYDLLSRSTPDQPVLTAFPQNMTACDKYFGCPFRDFCNAWANPLRGCQKPPLGYKVEFWDPTEHESKKTINV